MTAAGWTSKPQPRARPHDESTNEGSPEGADVRALRTHPHARRVSDHLAAGFGARVRALRGARGWSLGELAGAIGVDPRTVMRLELGRRSPTLEYLVALARVLAPEGTSPSALESELLGLAGEHVRYRRGGQTVGVVSRRQMQATLRRARVRRGGRS